MNAQESNSYEDIHGSVSSMVIVALTLDAFEKAEPTMAMTDGWYAYDDRGTIIF